MVRINDIENEALKNANKFEEQKNGNGNSEYQQEISGGYYNDTVNFDRDKYGKKPDPFFGFSHDPYVQSSEDPEKLKEIEKAKKIQFTMAKTSNSGFFNGKEKANGISQYQNNPNLSNFNQYQKLKNSNNRVNYGGNMVNNLGGVGQLNIEGNVNGGENGLSETKKMNRTSIGFGPIKKTYEEKLDSFMARNNLKYIEPQKAEKKPPTPQPEPEPVQPTVSNKEKKPNVQKGPVSANKKVNNKK